MFCPTCGGPVEIVDDHEERRCSGASLGPGLRYLSTAPAGPVRLTEAVRWTEADVTKTEDDSDFPAAAYAYVPDAEKPSTWKLRLWEDPDTKETAKQVGMALAALSPGGFRGKKVAVPAEALPAVKRKIFAAWKKVHGADDKVPEVLQESVDDTSFDDIRQGVMAALSDKLGLPDDVYFWISDLSDTWCVYSVGNDYYRLEYSMSDDGTVTFSGDPVEVVAHTTYEPTADDPAPKPGTTEARSDRIHGRVLEAKGSGADGGRIFGVQILAYGDSRNGRRYPESVMRAAAPKYEGAKAYDHHRTDEELRTSTIGGLVGWYENVKPDGAGLQGDLHLLPSAIHAAEALDASLAAQDKGLPPLIGVSHDVQAQYQHVVAGGKRFMEATEIVSVNSTDLVANPAAGGKATRMVAGGPDDPDPEEGTEMTLKELLALLRAATAEKRTELLTEHKAALDEFGLDEAAVTRILTEPAADPPATDPPAPGSDPVPDPALVGATESITRDSTLGGMLVREAVRGIGLDERFVEGIAKRLPDRFTETQLTEAVEGYRDMRVELEKEMLGQRGGVPHVSVSQDAVDAKVKRLDAMFAGDFKEGYRSLKQAFVDITGVNPYGALDAEDFNRLILRESIGSEPFDSARTRRLVESAQTGTWNLILGDSITRRMVADYEQPDLMNWRSVVSSIVPLQDFRTQRLERLGGYGVLPAVNQGAPYQPLTTPTNEEATYALAKKGGTEDLTLETIANDDLRMVQMIPKRLGLAAAQTLYRFVWDILITNAIYTPDTVALFAAGHNNTDTNALSRSAMDTGRRKMRKQTAYGDSTDLLSIVPKYLITPPDLENLAWQICTSGLAIPTAAPDGAATNLPNIHQGMTPIVIDYWSSTSTTAWFLAGDSNKTPMIELGFYQGRQDPELFVQNDPTVGSVFTADKLTWKIRHIYGGTVVDYRALYRGNA
jgi:hypothetical protein